MVNYLAYTTFGWLVLAGILHFAIDVVSQYLRGVRVPGYETTLYYGLHSSYAASLLLLGGLGLIITSRASTLLYQRPVMMIYVVATLMWFAIGFLFIEYREPKMMLAIYAVLLAALVYTVVNNHELVP